MSIFTRPASPPPRQPSPDITPAPLPSPHLRARVRPSSSKQSLSSPSLPPGLNAFPHKSILSARSYDHINEKANQSSSEPGHGHRRKRTRSNLTVSPPTTPRSLPIPSKSHSTEYKHYRRTLSCAIPYRSPPPSPTLASAPPPVPPMPAFVLSPYDDVKNVHRPRQSSTPPIQFPELDSLSSLSESISLSQKPSRALPSSDAHKTTGMTCLKFFSLRNSKQRTVRNASGV